MCACHPRRHWCSHGCAFGPTFCCPLCRPNSHTVVGHPTLFLVAIFHICFHCILTHFRCSIYTPRRLHETAVSCERSNCNKENEFGKIMLQEVSQSLIYQVALINQYWVHLHGDFRRNESTMILASSTKTQNSFVSIVGFVELLLLVLSIAQGGKMLV